MSDTQEKRPEAPADPKESQAVPADAEGHATPEASDHASVNEDARLAALNELDAARKQLLAAQQQMDIAQSRLQALENGIHTPAGEQAMSPQKFASLPSAGDEEPKPSKQPAKETAPAVEHFGALNALFDGFSKLGPIAIFIFMACMAWPIFLPFTNLTYCPGEIKSITAILHMAATGAWLTPTGLENGVWALPQWPAFSWCVALLALIPGIGDSYLLLPIVSFGCAFAALFAVWCLTIGTGFGGKAAMAAVIILLCAPLFAPMPHFIGPAALTAAFMLFALLFFYRGWISETSWICLPLAFIFTACAGLSGGILPFVTPLAASICFLIWRGSVRRAQKLDAIFGFILLLVIIGVWLGLLMSGQGNENYLHTLFANAWQFALPVPLVWFLAMIVGIFGLLPWILMIFGVSWGRVLARSARSFSASRHENGSAMLWISLVVALGLSLFIPWFHGAAIIIGCLLAILLGKAFARLSHFGNCFFFLLASICVIVAGVIVLLLSFSGTQGLLLEHMPQFVQDADVGAKLLTLGTLPIMGAILLVGGLLGLFFVKRCRGYGGLFYAMLLVIILCQPARLMLVPELTAMPGTPLVSLAVIEKQVMSALQPAAPAQSAVIAPEPAAPVAEPPAVPEADAPAATSGPAQIEPVAPDNNSDVATPPSRGSVEPGADTQAAEPAADAPSQPAEKMEEVIIIEQPAGVNTPATQGANP